MRTISQAKPNWYSLSLIADNIAKLYDDGLSFVYIFELLNDLDLSDKYKIALLKVKDSIKNGSSLKDAFKSEGDLFPNFFIEMIGVGEKTGNISKVLEGLKIFYSKLAFIKKFVINALSYPLIISISALGVCIFLSIAIIPSFKEVYVALGKEVPKSFNYIINIKEFILKNKLVSVMGLLLWGMALPYIAYKVFIKDNIYKVLRIFKLYTMFVEYINIMLLAVIIKSGINLIEGLEFCSDLKMLNQNNYVISNIKKEVILGESLSGAMRKTKVFSDFTLAHIKLGEESGSLDLRLMQIEESLFTRIQDNLNKKINMIQPLIIMIIGGVVMIFILIFILPIFGELL